MKKIVLSLSLLSAFFLACSSEPKSKEYYDKNPKEKDNKKKECKELNNKFTLENLNMPNKDRVEAFKKSLGETLAKECENAGYKFSLL